MASSSDSVVFDVLCERLQHLERKIYGNDNENDSNVKISESLQDVNSRISAAVTGREKMKNVLKRVDEIERYLDPAIGEQMTMEHTTKFNIILASEQNIRETASQLYQINEFKGVLDSEHIKATPSLGGRLSNLNHVLIKQRDEAAAISEDVKHLLNSYNDIISTISKQFVQWDEIVTKLEMNSESKKKTKK